jgi:hypothetical protein
VRTYHGWVVVREAEPGYNHPVYAEFRDNGERQVVHQGFGNSGCATAIEFWDKKVGQTVKLESVIKGCHRVYTESDNVPFGYWDVFNEVLYHGPEAENEAKMAERGGNKIIPLYDRHGPR